MRQRLPIAISSAALVVAVLGTTPIGHAAYNKIKVPRNSVGTAQLKNNSVNGGKVRNNSLTGADVRNNSLTGADVRNGSLAAVDFAAGQLPGGQAGEKGDKGDKGDAGPVGISSYQVVTTSPANLAAGATGTAEAQCPGGKKPIGGGGLAGGGLGGDNVRIYGSYPNSGGWVVHAKNVGAFAASITAYAVCANVAG